MMEYLTDPRLWLTLLIGVVVGIPIAKCMQAGMSEPWQKIIDAKNAETERLHGK